MCGAAETQAHLFRCPHYQEWRNDFETELLGYLKRLNTRPRLTRAIALQVSIWFHANRPPDGEDMDDEIIQFFCGIISKHWIKNQEIHLRRLGRPNATGIQWGIKLIKHIITQFYQLWRLRCDSVFGGNQKQADTYHREIAIHRATFLYGQGKLLNYQDKTFFDRPLRDVIDQHTSSIESWIQGAEIVVRKGARDV